MLRWGSVVIVLLAVVLLVTVWRVPTGVDTGAAWTLTGVCVLGSLAAPFMLRRARQWQKLAQVPTEREPARVEVIRVALTRAGFAVDYRPIRGARIAHTLGIDRWFDLEPPRPGEELEVWSLGADGRGPLLVRQVDGTWWAASGRLY